MSIFSVHIIRQKYVKNEKHFQMTIHDSGYKVWHYLSFKKIPVKKKLQRNTSKEKLKIEVWMQLINNCGGRRFGMTKKKS